MSQAVYKFLAIALVVGVIGPLFWLGVAKFELHFYAWLHRTRFYRRMPAFLKADVRDLLRRRKAPEDTQRLSGPAWRGRQ